MLLDKDPNLKIAVIDLDVHQGDGTAQMLKDKENCFTISVHAKNNFPFRKAKSSVDIELDDGVEDDMYLDNVKKAISEVERFSPQILFYQAGVDPLKEDRLGRLNVSEKGLQERDNLVHGFAAEKQIPIVTCMGGGYFKDDKTREIICRAHANQVRSLYSYFS